MNIISQISPVTDAEAAAGLVRPGTVAALAEDITRTLPATAVAAGTGAPRPRRWARRAVIGVPVAAALAVADWSRPQPGRLASMSARSQSARPGRRRPS